MSSQIRNLGFIKQKKYLEIGKKSPGREMDSQTQEKKNIFQETGKHWYIINRTCGFDTRVSPYFSTRLFRVFAVRDK